MYYSLFLRLPIERYFGCFQALINYDKASKYLGAEFCVDKFSVQLGKYLKVLKLGYMLRLSLAL